MNIDGSISKWSMEHMRIILMMGKIDVLYDGLTVNQHMNTFGLLMFFGKMEMKLILNHPN